MTKILVIIGANRVRGVAALKGIKNDADLFMSLSDKLKNKGYSISLKYSKPIPADTDILIFSGHGGLINGKMILLAPSKYRNSISALTNDDVISSSDIPNGTNVILDACYSSAIKNGLPIKFIKGINLEKAESVNLSDKTSSNFIHTGLFSSDENSPSYEINVNGHNHGSMCYALETMIKVCRDVNIVDPSDLEVLTLSMRSLLEANGIKQDVRSRVAASCPDKITPFVKVLHEVL